MVEILACVDQSVAEVISMQQNRFEGVNNRHEIYGVRTRACDEANIPQRVGLVASININSPLRWKNLLKNQRGQTFRAIFSNAPP